MQRLFHNKYGVIFAGTLALLALVLLTASLARMEFHPSEPIGHNQHTLVFDYTALNQVATQAAAIPPSERMFLMIAAFLVVLLIVAWINPELRKRLLYALVRLIVIVLGVLFLLRNNPGFFADLFKNLSFGISPVTAQPQNNLGAPVFEPPHVSDWITFVWALGVILLTGLGIRLFRRGWIRFASAWLHSASSTSTGRPFEEFSRIARQSLNDLNAGRNFENAIVECYARMSAVVDKKRGVRLERAMTPAEFAERLMRAGLPREPVEKLTHLFERVRYGRLGPGAAEVNEAASSLRSILEFCGEPA